MVFIGNHRVIFCSKDDYLLRGAELLGLDTNNDLLDLIKELREGQFDYTVCTASNPHFSMGAGWDAAIKRLHPELCQKKFDKLHPYNERMGNLLFLITVGYDLLSTKEILKDAFNTLFGDMATQPPQTYIITGFGTGIGGMSRDDFLWELDEFLKRVRI